MLIKKYKVEYIGCYKGSIDEVIATKEYKENLSKLDKLIGHLKKHKTKYMCLVIFIATLLFFYTPEKVVEVFMSIPKGPTPLDPARVESLNHFTVGVLLKAYMALCMGALAVETVSSGWQNEKKFGSSLMKYSLAYAGGLLCIMILNMFRSLM